MNMARACIKCREYVIIAANDPKNQIMIKAFEDNHTGHNLVTLNHIEIKDTYQEVKSNAKQTVAAPNV